MLLPCSLIEDAEAIIATPSGELAETILATLDNFEVRVTSTELRPCSNGVR